MGAPFLDRWQQQLLSHQECSSQWQAGRVQVFVFYLDLQASVLFDAVNIAWGWFDHHLVG